MATDISKVLDSIREFKFTPILGAGCSLNSNNSHGFIQQQDKKAYRLALCKYHFLNIFKSDLNIPFIGKNYLIKYIDNFIKHIGVNLIGAYKNHYNVISRKKTYNDCEYGDIEFTNCMISFQVSLLISSAIATSIITSTIKKGELSITNLSLDFTESPLSVTESCVLCNSFMRLADKVTSLKEAKKKFAKESILEVSGIYQRIIFLILEYIPCISHGSAKLKSENCMIVDSWRERHSSEIEQLISSYIGGNFNRSDYARLSLYHIEWLNNLLLYSLRFDLCDYPSTPELAFQISLCEGSFPPKVVSLSKAAQASGDVLNKLKLGFRKIEDYKDEHRIKPDKFHLSMAISMHYLYEKNYVSKSKGAEGSKISLPIILTTNYGNEIEAAFDHLYKNRIGAYHVVIPVNSYSEEVNNVIPHWLLRTLNTYVSPSETWRLLHHDIKDMNEEMPINGLSGPIIIKLHGSPTYNLPQADSSYISGMISRDTNKISEFRHRIVISESHYLKDIVSEKQNRNLPKWLTTYLTDKTKTLCFLGHSVSDPNIRLYLYYYKEEENPVCSKSFFISSPSVTSSKLGSIFGISSGFSSSFASLLS